MNEDRFGNPHAPNLSYARGKILASTEDDFRKLQHAWRIIRERGPKSTFIFTGLDHSLPMQPEDIAFADDEIGAAIHYERLKELTLEHLGGNAERHDIAVFNRLTGATLATHLTLVRPGDVVVGVSASHSHPSVLRAASHAGARFIDTAGLAEFKAVMERERNVALVDLTRLAVTYEILPIEAIREVVRIAHDKGALVYIDDAGGARVDFELLDRLRDLIHELARARADQRCAQAPQHDEKRRGRPHERARRHRDEVNGYMRRQWRRRHRRRRPPRRCR